MVSLNQRAYSSRRATAFLQFYRRREKLFCILVRIDRQLSSSPEFKYGELDLCCL